jgi:YfiH family protein
VYHWRTTVGPVDLAFTDRQGGADSRDALPRAVTDFADGALVAAMHQVHGNAVVVVGDDAAPAARPDADALVTAEPDTVLVVRVADCVPVLLADPDGGVVGADHAGRVGMVAGVAPAAVAAMRSLGADSLTAWLGPRICGACYEVPAQMQAEVGARVPEAVSTTSWGTPALDVGAGVRAQLEALGVTVVDVATCTRESSALHSYRRDAAGAGRIAGLVVRRADA